MKQNIIAQYTDLQKEIEEIKQNITRLTDKKEALEQESSVEIVKGGYGGEQRYHIKEFAKADIEETEYLINKNIRLLRERQKRAEELIVEIEEYINAIDDSRVRRMITLKYINGKTWYQVAQIMGEYYTQDSCKKQVQRYIKNV